LKPLRILIKFSCLALLFLSLTAFNREGDPEKTECLDCHDDIKEVMKQKFLHYPFENEQCDACHDSKTYGFAEEGAKLCTVCHRDFGAEGEGNVLHEAVDDWTNCHNPHASQNAALLVEKSPEICFMCHEGLPGKEPASVHAPYESGECITCHDPHISPNRSLLVEKSPALCAECHDTADADFNGAHLNLLTSGVDCLSCHEGHFSSNESLILANSHPPFSEKMCDSCHEMPEGNKQSKLVAEGAQLCTECHSDMGELLQLKFPHIPAEEDCLNCHEPHATSSPKLLIKTGMDLCSDCHDELPVSDEEMRLHEPFSDGQCTDCHDPHGSDQRGVLALDERDLCLQCHSEIAEMQDGQTPHTAVLQGCVACHEPHKGRLEKLLKDKGEALCFKCHESREQKVSRFVHFPYKQGNCSTCHMPHSGADGANFAKDTRALCTLCHPSEHKAFPHPTGIKPSPDLAIQPGNKLNFSSGDTLTCTTCHEPHATDIVFLLHVGVTGGELCYQCHRQ